MSIDWITVAAQLANFLILIGLLKRFLYRPILDGIDAREHQIAERMSEAASVVESAKRARSDHEHSARRLSTAREQLLKETRRVAEADRDALLEAARKRMQRERDAEQQRREREAARYSAELHRTGARTLLSLTRKVLLDLSDETLEQRIVRHALERSQALAAALEHAAANAGQAILSTRDPMSDTARKHAGAELAPVLHGVELRFRTDPAQAPGLSLQIGGARLEWTTDSYIDRLQDLLSEGLAEGTTMRARSASLAP